MLKRLKPSVPPMMPHLFNTNIRESERCAEENVGICSVEEIQEIYSDLTALAFPEMRMIRSRRLTDVGVV
jgi:hypothetical protein